MPEIKCPNCGAALQTDPAQPIRFCPQCGRELVERSAPGPSDLSVRIAAEKKPQKKYKIIMEALAAAPDDFEANKALLYHGRLHESLAQKRGVDFSIIKCHLLSVFHTPSQYAPDTLDAKYEELLRGPQLQKTMALAPDAQAFFTDYLLELAFLYVDLFIRGDSKYNSVAFGLGRSPESTARKCADPVRDMLRTIAQSDRLDAAERAILLRGVREGYARVFPGYANFLEEDN